MSRTSTRFPLCYRELPEHWELANRIAMAMTVRKSITRAKDIEDFECVLASRFGDHADIDPDMSEDELRARLKYIVRHHTRSIGSAAADLGISSELAAKLLGKRHRGRMKGETR